jgi:hypothetical protein
MNLQVDADILEPAHRGRTRAIRRHQPFHVVSHTRRHTHPRSAIGIIPTVESES